MKVIDAQGLILGRLASSVAKDLLNGEQVAIINAEKAFITGRPKMIYSEYKKKRDLKHPRKGPFFPKRPDRILKRTVRGMIPYQTPSGRKAFKNLKVYIGTPREFQGKKIQQVEHAKNVRKSSGIELGDVSRFLGGKF